MEEERAAENEDKVGKFRCAAPKADEKPAAAEAEEKEEAEEKKPEVREESVEEEETEVEMSEDGHPGSSGGSLPVDIAGMSTAGWDSTTPSFTFETSTNQQ